jgi:hypothetical protein
MTKMRKIICLNNNFVELNNILSISVNGYPNLGPTNRIKIEFNLRKEYIYNPNIELWELETFNDVLYIDFPDYETAKVHLNEMFGEWQFYLDEKN